PLNDKSRDIYTLPKFSPQLSISSKETLPSLKEDLFPNLFIEKSAAAPLSSTHSVPQSIPRLPHPVYPAPEVLTMAQNRARAASLTENAERISSSSRSPPESDRLSSPLPSTPPTSPVPVSAPAPIRQRSQSMDCIVSLPITRLSVTRRQSNSFGICKGTDTEYLRSSPMRKVKTKAIDKTQ